MSSTLLTMTRGDTAVYTVTLTDADGEPVDLTGLDITFTAKSTLLDTHTFIEKQLDVAGGSGDMGICTLTIEPSDTEDLPFTERFLWNIQVDDGFTVDTPLIGRLVVSMDVVAGAGSGS